tara:strand:+ start:116 stop:409 length:294 start_codon:yes stop_codon:yes gene_type:complete
LFKWTIKHGTGCLAMTSSVKLFGDRSDIDITTATKTHFHPTISLFVSDEGTLDTDNPKTSIDHIFGVSRNGTGARKILASGRQPRQPTVASQLDPLE